jgi:hypothetical protein
MSETPAEPESETLARAERAYEVGDFRSMRSICAPLVSSTDSEVSAKARALIDKVTVDAQAGYALAFSFALACVIVLVYAL